MYDTHFASNVFLFSCASNDYILTVQDHVEYLTKGQGHDLFGKDYVAYQYICDCIVGLNTSIVFSSLYLVSINGDCRKTAGDLS